MWPRSGYVYGHHTISSDRMNYSAFLVSLSIGMSLRQIVLQQMIFYFFFSLQHVIFLSWFIQIKDCLAKVMLFSTTEALQHDPVNDQQT